MTKDLLGRETFLNRLETIITKKSTENEGFSFAIDGKWGCGKSWILKELKKRLESKKYFVIHYNCWENEYYEEPLVAILSVIVDKLNDVQETIKGKAKKEKLKIAADFLIKVAAIIAKSKFGIDFPELNKAGKEAIDAESTPIIPADFDINQPLKSALTIVRNQLLELNNSSSEFKFKGVVIIVDELDRCLPEYAIKVMQRLHHICFNNIYDKYDLIQLAGINKNELLGSIAKTFGREFNLTQKYTPTENGAGVICYDNFEYSQIQFADYYFKKFFQLIIPVSNAEKEEDSFEIFDSFKDFFDFSDSKGKKILKSFLIDVLLQLPMRTVIDLIHLVQTAHQITIMDKSSNTKYNCRILCVEFIQALYSAVFKEGNPILTNNLNEKKLIRNGNYIYLQVPNLTNIDQIPNASRFTSALTRWSQCNFEIPKDQNGFRSRKPQYVLDAADCTSYILSFFNSRYNPNIEFLVTMKGKVPSIEKETSFFMSFRSTLKSLI